MSKTVFIKSKYIPYGFPVSGTILTYLLYKSINPSGTERGVILTLFIGWLAIRWLMAFYLVFNGKGQTPVFKEDS